jgi:hypothetical protein
MVINKKWNIRLALFTAFAGLVVWMTFWGGSPTLAQTFVFEKIQDRPQSVEVRDAEGTLLGSGNFRASVSSNRNGRTHGQAVLQMPDFAVELEFTGVDEIFYEDGNPVGVVLNGRGSLLRDGQTETFFTTVRVEAETSVPECLIWDIPGNPVLEPLNFEAEGMLRFRDL